MDTIPDRRLHEEALDRGVWIQYDCFGMALENDWYSDPGDDDGATGSSALPRPGGSGACSSPTTSGARRSSRVRRRRVRPPPHDHSSRGSPSGASAREVERLFVEGPAEFLTWVEPAAPT